MGLFRTTKSKQLSDPMDTSLAPLCLWLHPGGPDDAPP